MAVSVRVLFATPQAEIASLIRSEINACSSASFVTGFITMEGVEALVDPIKARPSKLAALVVGAGTYRAYEALDTLLDAGVDTSRLYVHLGHTKRTGGGAKHLFYRYHPMLHSKVIYLEYEGGRAKAFIGSHNLTGFALLGLNGEASVLLEGHRSDAEFEVVRSHIEASRAQSIQYVPGMKEALTWWTSQFIDGLAAKVDDAPRDGESKRTIVILAQEREGQPRADDIVYFELPRALGRVQSLNSEVHIYLFSNLPPDPWLALRSLRNASRSYWCQTKGLEVERGGVELRADWYVENSRAPNLLRAPQPFRPNVSTDMQQVRASEPAQIN